MTDLAFRRLLWLYVGLTVAGFVASAFPQHSDSLQAAADLELNSLLFEKPWFLAGAVVLIVAWLVGLVGLFRFKAWSRPLSLYSTVAALLAFPIMGSTLYWGVEAAIYNAGSIAWGGILALAYFSPVSALFER